MTPGEFSCFTGLFILGGIVAAAAGGGLGISMRDIDRGGLSDNPGHTG